MKRPRVVLLIAILLLLSVLPVQAHGYIVRGIPANRAVLDRAPARLQYWFSESLEPAFSALNLRDATGKILLTGGVDAHNGTLLSLQIPPGTLPDGAYVVEMRPAFSSDGHAAAESYVFYIGKEISGIDGQARDNSANVLEIVWKALLLGATFMLFGAFTLYAAVFVPAWGSAAYPAGLLPPRVMQRLNRIVWAGIALALIANVLALIQQTMVFFNVDALTVISGGLWQVVRSGSRAGDVWTLRMVLLVLLAVMHGATLYYRDSVPGIVRAFWNANAWLMALMIGTQAVNSHAAGSFVLPWIAMLMHWLHSLSVAFWVGGLIGLVLVLPVALLPYSGDARRTALIPVMQRFSRLMTGMIALVITTGIYNATNWFYAPDDFITPYGGALAFKVLMVALLLPLAAVHFAVLNPARAENMLKRIPSGASTRVYDRLTQAAAPFTGTLRLEVILAMVTLVLASVLSATPVPEPDFLRKEVPLLTATQQVNGLDVTLTLTPGAPGINTFDVVIQRGGANVTDAKVTLQIVNPGRDTRTRPVPVDALDDGLYGAAADSIDREGTWWTLLDIHTGDTFTRVFFEWHITNDAAVLQSRPPSLLTLAALLAVIASALYSVYPALGSLARWLNVTPLSLLVGVVIGIISIGVLAFSMWFIQEQTRLTELSLLPPPQIVNTVPPDAASLARGEALYDDACQVWESSSDFAPLVSSTPVLRDEDLFRVIGQGWRTVPACDRVLTDAETWDVVNFFRTKSTQ